MENDQHFDAFGGLGGGIGYAIDRNWVARGDYRALVAGHDTEINHHILLSIGYRWGAGDSVGGSGAGSSIANEVAEGLQPIYFEYDKAGLTPDSQRRLEANARYLLDNPDVPIILEGHCDERGTNEYNYALGAKRAHSAREFLRALGVSAERMETISYGEDRPAVDGHNEAAWSKNRRVECIAK
jgi:peptidoglycan-associated lipoprotein